MNADAPLTPPNPPEDDPATNPPASAPPTPASSEPAAPIAREFPPLRTSLGSFSGLNDATASDRLGDLQAQERSLKQEIASQQRQLADLQAAMGQVVKEGLSDLEQRRQTLQVAVEQLERRQERIRNEMKTTFAGASQDLAIRVQGFKDYLVGSLQDLAAAAEQLQLSPPEAPRRSPPRPDAEMPTRETDLQLAESRFQAQTKRIQKLLDQYRMMPDYYGPPWQLRRTFEPIHADRVSDWFFTQGGRGAMRSMGSRLQNILLAAAIISVLRDLHGNRLRTLVLGNSPERLGEWRRGLQDFLGVSRADFGVEEGIILFEAPEPLVQRADRLLKQKQLPLIIVDETEVVIDIALLQFPLWLAFASDPANPVMY